MGYVLWFFHNNTNLFKYFITSYIIHNICKTVKLFMLFYTGFEASLALTLDIDKL